MAKIDYKKPIIRKHEKRVTRTQRKSEGENAPQFALSYKNAPQFALSYKKLYGPAKLDCLKMYKEADKVIKSIGETMKN